MAKDRSVTLEGRLYEAPVSLIGKRIELLYHNSNVKRVEARLNNQSYGFLRPVDLAVNCRRERGGGRGKEAKEHPDAMLELRERRREHLSRGRSCATAQGRWPVTERSAASPGLRYIEAAPGRATSLYVTATTGSILELYRQIASALGAGNRGISRAVMLKTIRGLVTELSCSKKLKLLLIIDEASLLRMEVLSELHTLLQFEKDAKPYLPLVLAGQNNLLDSLAYRPAAPLASRVVARSHLEGVGRGQMQAYIAHHLAIAGVTPRSV